MKRLLLLALLLPLTVFAQSSQVNLAALASKLVTPGIVPLTAGGTGVTTAAAAINQLLPSQTGQSGTCLGTNGSSPNWVMCGSGGGSPGGSNTNIQINSSGTFGGITYPQFQANLVAANANVISATAATGPINDYDPSGWGANIAYLHITPASGGTTLGGLVANSSAMQVVFIDNAETPGTGTDMLTLTNEASTESTAANRFHMTGNAILMPGARLMCVNETTTLNRWVCQ